MDVRADAKFAHLSSGRSDLFYLLLLLALVLPLRAWLLFNTEVAARDSIGYIRYALHFETQTWGDAVRSNAQHPGYSFCVWLLSQPLRAAHGTTDAEIMRLAAQGVSAIAALLLIVPMFYLGKEVLGPRVAFWGALLFQYLPVSGHHLSDGVSEPLFLLLTTTGLWQALVGFRRWSAGAECGGRRSCSLVPFALCGLFGGLAYWTRPEGAFVVAAAGLALVGRQLLIRVRWREFLVQGACLAAPALALAGGYVWVTGELTRKIAPRFMIGWETMRAADSSALPSGRHGSLPESPGRQDFRLHGRGLFASAFGAFIPQAKDYPTRFRRAGQTYFMELIQGFHYAGALFALLGLVWYGGYLIRMPGFWVLLVYGMIQTATLLLLAVRAFYISDRHMMVIVLSGTFLMAAGLLEAGRRAQDWLRQTQLRESFARWSMPTLLATVMLGLCMPKTLQRVHGNRAGNYRAGAWLRENVRDGDLVVDDHCWSHFYAGQVFLEGNEPEVPADYQPRCFVVMTRAKVRQANEAREAEEERLRAAGGRIVYHWPEEAHEERARVAVYEVPRDFQRHPWKVARLP